MNVLKGYKILAGRNPVKNNLLVAVYIDNRYVKGPFGQDNIVPNGVSRCKVEEGSAHIKIEIDQDRRIHLTNFKSPNVTYVNDREITTAIVSPKDKLTLGGNKYPINLVILLTAAKQIICKVKGIPFTPVVFPSISPGPTPKPPKTEAIYDISHLRIIWNDHIERVKKIRKGQKRLALIGSISLIFSLSSGALSYILKSSTVLEIILPILTIMGLLACIISFFMRANDKSVERLEAERYRMMEIYVCPNESCRRFLGEIPYQQFRNQYRSCPQCKNKYTEC